MKPGGPLGRSTTRVDGPLKVSGRAPYTADHRIHKTDEERPFYAWIVEAKVGKGRIVHLDVEAAAAAEGVVRVISHRDAPPQKAYGQPEDADRFSASHALLVDREVRYHGQPVAIVVATTLEAARGAAPLVDVRYETEDGRFVAKGDESEELLVEPDELDGGQEPDVCRGDFDEAMRASDVKVDAIYTTPGQISGAMEPHATLATWDGDTLTVRTSIQIVASAVTALANTFQLDEGKVRVLSPYIGGGFGSKLGIHSDAVLASIATLVLKHPVLLVQTRRNVFSNGPHRSNAHQRLRLGAKSDGTLLAVGHESVMPMAKGYEFAEPVAAGARATYRCDALRTVHRVVKVDMPPIDSMRAPGEAIGSLALEGAMDELAVGLGMDPLALRLKNLAEVEPQSGKPFASYDLRRCLEEGAAKFGWSERPAPKQQEGRWWKGWGMASCTRVNMLMEAEARIRLDAEGKATAELDMTDIGTGTYTILTQIVAEELGLPMRDVTVVLGDSNLPKTAGSGGSFGSASAGGALKDACRVMGERLREIAETHGDSALRDQAGDLRVEGGRVHRGGASMSFADVVGLTGGSLETLGHIAPGEDQEKFAQYAYGAHFVELAVDGSSGEVRLKRALGAFSFGRVLNPLTARSQLIGAMTYGIGGALTEGLELDPRYGAFMNRDFAEYHLAVNRDIPPLEVLMLGEPDEKCGKLGSKGIGELGLCGIGGAIANAVFHATGVRVRDFPITPDRVLAGLPPLG